MGKVNYDLKAEQFLSELDVADFNDFITLKNILNKYSVETLVVLVSDDYRQTVVNETLDLCTILIGNEHADRNILNMLFVIEEVMKKQNEKFVDIKEEIYSKLYNNLFMYAFTNKKIWMTLNYIDRAEKFPCPQFDYTLIRKVFIKAKYVFIANAFLLIGLICWGLSLSSRFDLYNDTLNSVFRACGINGLLLFIVGVFIKYFSPITK